MLGFIFNNYSSFVNPSLHLILCGDGVYIYEIKKNMVSCHAVEWHRMKVIRNSFLARRILLIESYGTVTQLKAEF